MTTPTADDVKAAQPIYDELCALIAENAAMTTKLMALRDRLAREAIATAMRALR